MQLLSMGCAGGVASSAIASQENMCGGLGDRIRLQYISFLPLFQRIALKGIVPVNAFSLLMFALCMLRRDARAGELRLLAAALLLAVAALSAVGFFTDRVSQALTQEANQLLGADLLLRADHPWSGSRLQGARALGLRLAETRVFPSMVMVGQGSDSRAQLAEIKAVSADYPLRGRLRIAPAANAPDAPSPGVPPSGTIWLDERLLAALTVQVGDRVQLGALSLKVAAVLTQEPDRGLNFLGVAPRLMMNLDDLAATGLIQPGSRVTYRLLLAGEASALAQFRAACEATLERGERIEDASNARPEIRSALERAQKFLGLATMLTVVLAAVAVALASRRYVQRHLDPCAVMRCLGATQAFLLRVFMGQLLLLGLLAVSLGCLLGYGAHFLLHAWLAQWLGQSLPLPGWTPAGQGGLVGLILLFGFSLPPILQLKRVSTLRVLRREFSAGSLPPWRLLAGYAIGLGALAALLFWLAGEWRLGAYLVAGFAGAFLGFASLARLAVWLAAKLRGAGGVGWRFGLANLERHALASVVQIVALALGFMALLLLTVIRNDLLQAWQRAIPADAPNRFVLNIQPEQLAEVRHFFAARGFQPEFAPMIRARLTQVNGQAIRPADYADEQTKRLVEREFNLSYRVDLPPGNSVTAGRWFTPAEAAQGLASVEAGLAHSLRLKLGDRLQFTVAGETVEVQISSLRKLNWDSMRVNFFVLTPPGVLGSYPASWLTSFHLPVAQHGFVDQLIGAYPHLTVIDMGAIVRQLQSILDQVTQTVQFVFLFTLLAGVLVLYAALNSAADERRFELAVMRALGASRRQLRAALLAELAAIGGLAGLIAALGAMVVGQVLAQKVFQLAVALDGWLLPGAMLAGAVLVMGAGWLAASRLLDAPPLEALRA